MGWKIKLDQHAVKQLKKLDRTAQKRIVGFLSDRLLTAKTPRDFGKPLMGKLTGLWRYRVGDYRLICEINDKEVTVLVINIGHRKEIYQ
ncbi:MAG: addiction module toxin RelE [Gammaproteobacteria bacterium RIFCSPHIGHO2_02_FULL_42_13]|mgnify:FL=1|nr:MAG: addiction module toxin RelE [Gammaproteobacteria bacterium RIFCSPHIGHO2_02_FULL_42_13]